MAFLQVCQRRNHLRGAPVSLLLLIGARSGVLHTARVRVFTVCVYTSVCIRVCVYE